MFGPDAQQHFLAFLAAKGLRQFDNDTALDHRRPAGAAALEPCRQQIHRRRADEFGDEDVLRRIIEFQRRADLFDHAVAQDDDAIGHGQRLDLVVGDINRRRFQALMQRLDLAAHADPELGVQVGQRFVEQEDLGIAHDSAAHGDALALAAGERGGLAQKILRQVQHRGRGAHPLLDQLLVRPAHAQRKRHVFRHRHMGIEGIALENHGDVTGLRRQVRDITPIDEDAPGACRFQSRQQAQHGGFPAARRADQGQEFSVADGKVDVAEHLHGAEGLCQTGDFDSCHA